MSTSIPVRHGPARERRFVPSAAIRSVRVPGTVVWLGLAVVAALFLLPQAGTLGASLDVMASAHPVPVAAGGGLVALRYAMAAVSLQAAVPGRLPFAPTLLVQLASSFVGRFTPEGVGWLVLNQRFLERAGVTRATALAAISLKVLVGGMARLAIAAAVVIIAGADGDVTLFSALPPGLLTVMLAAGLAAVLVAATAIRANRLAGQRIQSALTEFRGALRDPKRIALLIGSSASLTLLSGLALAASASAVGADVSIAQIFVVYLGGTAIAAVSPTPGNIGAVEVTLTAGFTALGVAAATALAAVLVYRLLTFWLPVVPGFVALRRLRASSAL